MNGRRALSCFLAAFAVGATLGAPEWVSAYHHRLSAAHCRAFNEAGDARFDTTGLYNSGPGSERAEEYYCPVPSDTDMDHLTIRRVHLHGIDQNTTKNVIARACVTFFDVAGGACGAQDSSSFTGNYQIELTGTASGQELEQFANGANWGDFPYVYVSVPGRDVAVSSVRGIFVSTVF